MYMYMYIYICIYIYIYIYSYLYIHIWRVNTSRRLRALSSSDARASSPTCRSPSSTSPCEVGTP